MIYFHMRISSVQNKHRRGVGEPTPRVCRRAGADRDRLLGALSVLQVAEDPGEAAELVLGHLLGIGHQS